MNTHSPTYSLTQKFQQPAAIVAHLNTCRHFCLFLDIDGTLSAFHPDPDQSFIPSATLNLIKKIMAHDVTVAAVTGRQIATAKKLFAPLRLTIAGLHGLNIELADGTSIDPDLSTIDFAQIKQSLQSACTPYPQLLIEDKTHSFALHYRQHPELEQVAHSIMRQLQAKQPLMKLNHGKCVIELLPQQADKGHAIERILHHLEQSDRVAIFIGDDVTDENGFKAVNACGGISIKVGEGVSRAHYRLQDIDNVVDFLAQFEQFLDHQSPVGAPVRHGEKACLN